MARSLKSLSHRASYLCPFFNLAWHIFCILRQISERLEVGEEFPLPKASREELASVACSFSRLTARERSTLYVYVNLPPVRVGFHSPELEV